MTHHIETGTVISVGPVQNLGSKGTFQKRVAVIETGTEDKPNPLPFDVVMDDINLLDPIEEGDRVSITFYQKGNEWNGKNYSSNIITSIEKSEPDKPAEAEPTDSPPAPDATFDPKSDIPF